MNNLLSSANSELYHANPGAPGPDGTTASGDNATAYSPLGQLTGFSRGTLSVSSAHNNGTTGLDTVSSPARTQSFTLDPWQPVVKVARPSLAISSRALRCRDLPVFSCNAAASRRLDPGPTSRRGCSRDFTHGLLGNWGNSTTNGTTTSRTTNSKNEVTAVGSATLLFDHNGNTLTDQSGQTYTYDAWNRPVLVKNAAGTTIASYAYDANGRRINESGVDVYFSASGQELEDRVSGSTVSQYVWSATSINGLVLRDDIGGGSVTDRIYAQQDADELKVTGRTKRGRTKSDANLNDRFGR